MGCVGLALKPETEITLAGFYSMVLCGLCGIGFETRNGNDIARKFSSECAYNTLIEYITHVPRGGASNIGLNTILRKLDL